MIFLMILFNFASRQTAFYFTAILSLGIFLNSFMKFCFQDGRPFMWSSKIFPYACELEFGNPGTEAMNVIAFTFSAGLHCFEKLKQ